MAADGQGGRYRVDLGALDGERVRIDAREAHHMMVRRLRRGAHVLLFDGSGLEAEAELTALDAAGAVARVLVRRRTDAESPLRLWLVQALPVKLPRVDEIVRQATELGVTAIVPVVAAHSEVPGGGAAALARRADRWRRLADAAAKQSGRARVPAIDEPVAWSALRWERLPGPLLMLDARGESPSGIAVEARRAASVLSGPEGGWSEAERERAVARGARLLRLGPRILRADSAGPAALAILQHLWGDLR